MTNKQIKTLLLFAQNYSLQTIAKKQRVSLATIRERIKSLSKNHSREFNNAFGLRETYKRTRDAIRNTRNLSSLFFDPITKETSGLFSIDDITDMIQETF